MAQSPIHVDLIALSLEYLQGMLLIFTHVRNILLFTRIENAKMSLPLCLYLRQ